MDNPWSRGINAFFHQYTPAALERDREGLERESFGKFYSGITPDTSMEEILKRSQTTPGLNPEKGSRVAAAIEGVRKSKRELDLKDQQKALRDQTLKLAQADDKNIDDSAIANNLSQMDKDTYDQTIRGLTHIKPEKYKSLTPYQQSSVDIRNKQLAYKEKSPEFISKHINGLLKNDYDYNFTPDEKSWLNRRVGEMVNNQTNPVDVGTATDMAFQEALDRRQLIEDAEIPPEPSIYGHDETRNEATVKIAKLMNELGYSTKAQFAKLAKKAEWNKKADIDYMWDKLMEFKKSTQGAEKAEQPKKKTIEDAEALMFGD